MPPLEPPARRALARAWDRNPWTVVLLGVGCVLLLLVLAAVTERIAYRDRMLPGVQVGAVDVSGDGERSALRAVQAKARVLERTPIRVEAGSTRLSVDPSAIGLRIDAAASVRAAREAGRSRNPVDVLYGVLARQVRNDDVPLVIHVDRGRLEGVLDGWIAQTGRGLVDGGLRFEGTGVVEVMPKAGHGIRRDEARAAVLGAIEHGRTGVIHLTIGPTTPAVDRDDVEAAAARARGILGSSVALRFGDTTFTLTPQQIAATLGTRIDRSRLIVTVDPAKLRFVLGGALAALETPPKDASFAVSGTSVSVVAAVTGKVAELDAVARTIAKGRHSVIGTFETIEPARSTKWAENLHITELVSSFTTSYKCCEPRVTNIHRAADVIDDTVVEPGKTFSLNAALGPRTAAKGYVAAPAIGPDLDLEPDIGGGVSQLSTTLFNAVFFGCYQDVTHTVHSLYISRYPMGREATLNYPSIDNRFRNDTDAGVLIRTSYSSTAITVSLYGSKAGRSCRAEGPNILQTIPITTSYVDDPSLPAGTEKVLSEGHVGYVVENFRIISRPGQPDKRERYVEHYSMAPRKVARGTGAPPPTTTTVPAPPAAPPAG